MPRARPVFGPVLFALSLLFGGGAPGNAAAQFQGVKLIESGDATIRFEVSVAAPRFVAVPAAAGTAATTRLLLDDHENAVGSGDRALPGRIVVVAVPPLGEIRVSAIGGSPEVRDAVLLARAPGDPPGDRAPVRPASGTDASPQLRAELLSVGWLRNQRVARIALHPADYDADARRLVLYRRVDVTVLVEPAGDLGPPAESPDPFEGVYRGAVLNYEQGRGWRRPATRRLLERAAAGPGRLAAFAAAVPETSVYVGRPWIKIAVQQSGFYKVDYGRLRTLSLFSGDTDETAAPLDSLRLFNWPGLPVLPVNSYCDSCDFREVAIAFEDDGDGLFRTNTDQLYFFAMGPSDWASLYDAASPETVFVNHPYETNNYYYLTRATDMSPVGGARARIAVLDGTITDLSRPTPATFPARAHFEEDEEYWPNASPLFSSNDRRLFWEKWFWQAVAPGGTSSRVPALDLPGADTTQPARIRALAWGLNDPGSYPLHRLAVGFNGQDLGLRVFLGMLAQVYDATVTNLKTVANQFRMSVPTTVSTKAGLAWYDLFYRRTFKPVSDRLEFDTPAGGNGDVIYRLGPFVQPAPPFIFDVTDPGHPVQVFVPLDTTHYAPRPDGYYLRFQASETARRRYRVICADSIVSVQQGNLLEAPATSLENLRSFTERADYIVIYYDHYEGFQAAADSLVEWRRQHLPLWGATAPFEAKAVPISALYDQFSGGRTDPAAIRNFLRAAFYNWNAGGVPRRPTFVTFLGDASYDFKNITGRAAAGQPGCLVPTFEDNFDYGVMRQFVTDDWMLNVDDAGAIIPDFLGGRIPVGDAATALSVVRGKVLAHERSSPLGEWRNRVMLVADDNMQGERPDPLLWTHLKQTMRLDAWFTPTHLDREYVYLHTYPTGPGASKPGAKAAIREGINEGASLVNFVGHGSPFQLADERVMLDSDVGALTNSPRFTVLVSASCDVGKFSDPTVQSLGERLITSTTGGAVGVISATELSFSNLNSTLNQNVYRELFRRDTAACQYHTPLSEALLKTKAGSPNEQKYQLMGDAATLVALPRFWVDVALADSSGVTLTEVRRGQTLAFTGRVRTCPGGEALPFDGMVRLLIEDSQAIDSVMTDIEFEGDRYVDSTKYFFRAGTMYGGDVGVTNGEFHGHFVVPMEAREGTRGRVRAYVEGRSAGEGFDTDGAGHATTRVVPGEAPAGDVTGPRIALSFVGGATSVRSDAVLKVDLFDENGILTTNHTPQNGIIVTVDENTTNRADITGSFRYEAESYQSGTASFQLPDLALGPHKVSVSAADNLAAGLSAGAHRSVKALDFTVVDQPILRIVSARLFPNPTESGRAGGGGQFVVDAPGDSVNALLRIYTASGRLIRTLSVFGGLGLVQIPWDGLDNEGQSLANGVYFFRVHMNPRDPGGASSPLQKADADGRFVIVNRRPGAGRQPWPIR